MNYKVFLKQIREQLDVILTDDFKKHIDEEYDRFRNGNKISKAIIISRMIEVYKEAINRVCSDVQNGISRNCLSENDMVSNDAIEECENNESGAFSGSAIRRTKITELAADLFVSVITVFHLNKKDKNNSNDLKAANPIDKYDPHHASGRSLTEFIISCVDKNFIFAMKTNSKSEWENKKPKVVIHTYMILKELETVGTYDVRYADKMNKLKEMLTVDGTLRVNEKKAYNLSDDVLDVICDIIRLKYAEDNTNLNAVELKRELSVDALAEDSFKRGNAVPCGEGSDDVMEPEIPDSNAEEVYNNSLIWLMMDKLIEEEQQKKSPSVEILSGKDVFFFHAIIELGWGYSIIDRYPHLCDRKVLDFVDEILKKGIKPTQKVLAEDYFNVTTTEVTHCYKAFQTLVKKNISRE